MTVQKNAGLLKTFFGFAGQQSKDFWSALPAETGKTVGTGVSSAVNTAVTPKGIILLAVGGTIIYFIARKK